MTERGADFDRWTWFVIGVVFCIWSELLVALLVKWWIA